MLPIENSDPKMIIVDLLRTAFKLLKYKQKRLNITAINLQVGRLNAFQSAACGKYLQQLNTVV
jgi:hypothetical protein